MTPRAPILTLTALLGAGCVSYNARTGNAMGAFESGRFGAATERFEKALDDGPPFLRGAEIGMVELVRGNWPAAVEALTAAAEAVEDVEREALVSPENAGELLLSWTLNEGFTEYEGEAYERAMLHACLGLAYLALGKREDVRVEARRVDPLLTTYEELYETRYAAGGLAHALSAFTYELDEDWGDAYIDWQRMADKGIGGELAGRSLVRLSRALGRTEDHARWVERFGDSPPPPQDSAKVIVIAGVGLGPRKEEARLDLPTGDGVLSWAVPVIRLRPQPVAHLVLESPLHGARVRTSLLEDVGTVAKRNLEDRVAWMAAKSTVRTFLKRGLREKLHDEHGDFGAVVGDLFNILTERADLRAWTTLPNSWQAARLFVPPGPVDLTLEAPGAARVALGAFELEPGETLFVFARTLDRRLYAHVIGGQPLEISTTNP